MTTDTHADGPSEYLKPGDVARIFNVTPGTVRMWDRLGKLPAVRTPGGQRRFRRADVDALLAGDAA